MTYLEHEVTLDLDLDELAVEMSQNLLRFEIEDFIVELVEHEESDEMARNLLRFLTDYLEESN
ncbi:hypothetical protein E1264_03720 [Actinomadura sp. KC216]|uniref:hypothetical protein n=1 Tax=Actinomadura sp. KC216 TaxID=2530370 RepID=UPI0010473E64|nr:hypothetical protein [Actinomadura sp. KC216]TDB90926.1 hypothetical protein E1264_03720 [Actinomadura sp. KC216]